MTSETPYALTVYERDNPSRKLRALLGDTAPTPSGGGGGHATIPMPKQKALTVWQGIGGGNSAALTLTIPIIVGGAGNHVAPSVQAPLATLIKMWRPDRDTAEPPVLKLRCAGDVVPYQQLPWVLSDFQWGDAVADLHGHKTMQKLVLVLLEFVSDQRLKLVNLKDDKPQPAQVTYTVKKGDTLTSIAKHFKVPGGWKALGAAQHPPLNDPRKVKAHQKLIVPARGPWHR